MTFYVLGKGRCIVLKSHLSSGLLALLQPTAGCRRVLLGTTAAAGPGRKEPSALDAGLLHWSTVAETLLTLTFISRSVFIHQVRQYFLAVQIHLIFFNMMMD